MISFIPRGASTYWLRLPLIGAIFCFLFLATFASAQTAPTITTAPDTYTTNEWGGVFGVNLLDNDVSANGSALSLVFGEPWQFGTNGGTFLLSTDGGFMFDSEGQFDSLPVGQTAETSYIYTVTDGVDTATETVTVVVTGQYVNPNPTDTDGDGVNDAVDNCPAIANADQADNDGDGLGNVCDSTPDGDPAPTDTDSDGVADALDNCPLVANADQADNDSDGLGNVCDSTPDGDPVDTDSDGVEDALDNCPTIANTDQADNDNDGLGNVCDSTPDGDPNPTNRTDVKNYIFGHSLWWHGYDDGGLGYERSYVSEWLTFLAEEAGNTYMSDGQFGNPIAWLDEWAPSADWGSDYTQSAWNGLTESDPDGFANSDYDVVVFMPLNFEQWIEPNEQYYQDTRTPVEVATSLFEEILADEPDTEILIYAHYPDMGPFIAGGGSPDQMTQAEWDAYHAYNRGGYLDWFREYYAGITANLPGENIRMVEGGALLSDVLLDLLGDQIAPEDLFEDNAPHGWPTMYFLTSLFMYMEMYGERPPTTFTVPDVVIPEIRNNYNLIVDYMWEQLGNDIDPNPTDTDSDGVEDSVDNCVNTPNADQADNDGDGIGNVCDSTPDGDPVDTDGDGVEDALDNCPLVANADQADNDSDGLGNVCDSTPDGDPVNNPPVANPDSFTTTANTAVAGNVLTNDTDVDGDTLNTIVFTDQPGSNGGLFGIVADGTISFDPNGDFSTLLTTETTDTTIAYTATDGSATRTALVTVTVTGDVPPPPPDTDGDGVEDALDNCPLVANADQADNDGDGIGNVCDSTPDGDPVDTDGDGVEDALDNCPATANADQADSDGDGIGDACDPQDDTDTDGDGVRDEIDNCPLTANADQADNDSDGLGNVCDSTPDGDPTTGNITANPDTYTTNEWGGVFGVNLLDNDTSANGSPLTLVFNEPWQFGTNGGTFLLSLDGGFVFDPDGAFDALPVGQTVVTSYTYTVTDGVDTATSTVTVMAEL